MAKGPGFITLHMDDKEVRAAIGRAQAGVKPAMRGAADRTGKGLVRDMRGRLTRHKRIDTRRLYNAIAHRVVDGGDVFVVEVGPRIGDPGVEPYDEVVDKGRGKGKPWPPKGVLIPWMKRHAIPEEAEFMIRRKIGQEGTTPAPYLQTTSDHTAQALKEIDEVLTFVVRSFA